MQNKTEPIGFVGGIIIGFLVTTGLMMAYHFGFSDGNAATKEQVALVSGLHADSNKDMVIEHLSHSRDLALVAMKQYKTAVEDLQAEVAKRDAADLAKELTKAKKRIHPSKLQGAKGLDNQQSLMKRSIEFSETTAQALASENLKHVSEYLEQLNRQFFAKKN